MAIPAPTKFGCWTPPEKKSPSSTTCRHDWERRNNYDFDLKKEKEAALNAPENAEARKKYEEQKKNLDKVKNLNAMLAQARDQKKAGDLDGAVATMEQAVALISDGRASRKAGTITSVCMVRG